MNERMRERISELHPHWSGWLRRRPRPIHLECFAPPELSKVRCKRNTKFQPFSSLPYSQGVGCGGVWGGGEERVGDHGSHTHAILDGAVGRRFTWLPTALPNQTNPFVDYVALHAI